MGLMWLQQGTTQTGGYMIAGYGVIFGVMLVYLASLVMRRRNLRQELQILQEDENEEHLEG